MRGYCAAILVLAWAACMMTEGAVDELPGREVAPATTGGQYGAGEASIGVVWPNMPPLRSGTPVDAHQADLGEGAAVESEGEAAPTTLDNEKKDVRKEYFKIPNLKFETRTHTVKDTPLPKCKVLCDDKQETCQSFSFNEKTQECLWSEETFGYNKAWVYYAKEIDDSTQLKMAGHYRAIPGLKYQSKVGRIVKEKGEGGLDACQTDCDADPKCWGFGYTQITNTCGLTYDGAKFAQGWAMYLKPPPKTDQMEMLRVAQTKLPELKTKAFKAHRMHNKDVYLEKDIKNKKFMEENKAELNEKAITERTTKEVTEKKELMTKQDSEMATKTAQAVAAAKQAYEKATQDCKKAIDVQREAAGKYHECNLAHQDVDAEAKTAENVYEEQKKETQTADVNEKGAKSQAGQQPDNRDEREETATALRAAKKKEDASAIDLDTKVRAAEASKLSCKKLEGSLDRAKQASANLNQQCAGAQEIETKAQTAEQAAKLSQKQEELNSKELDAKAARKKEKAIKIANEKEEKAKEKLDKQQKERDEKEANEAATKSADTESKKKAEIAAKVKGEAHKKELEYKEQKDKVDAKFQAEAAQETAEKEKQKLEGGKLGVEQGKKLQVKALDEHAETTEKTATKMKVHLEQSGSTSEGEWAEERIYKEKASKIEQQAMEVRSKADDEKEKKAQSQQREKRMEAADKKDEQRRKKAYDEMQHQRANSKQEELDAKTSAVKEAADKKVEAERLHFEKMEKQSRAHHRDVSRWLRIQTQEHTSKGEWQQAQVVEAKLKKKHTEMGVKADLKEKEDKKMAQDEKRAKDEKTAKDEKAEKRKQAVDKETAAKADAAEVDSKLTKAQEADKKEVSAKEMKVKDDKAAAESADKKAAAIQKAESAEKREEALEIQDKKDASDKEVAAKLEEEERLAAEAAAEQKRLALVAKQAAAAAARAAENDVEKSGKLAAIEGEARMKKQYEEDEKEHKAKEKEGKHQLTWHEQQDKQHEKEQDVKELRTKKQAFNITYTSNWETSIQPGYAGAYSYSWKKLCVLGGVLSSEGTVAQERHFKKLRLFKGINSKGIKAKFWAKIGPQTNIKQAMLAAKLSNVSKEFWVDKLNFPLDQEEPPHPWDYLDHDYVEEFAANVTGELLIRKAGVYKFWLTSAGGSGLWIVSEKEGVPYLKPVVENDGIHGMVTKEGTIDLQSGTPEFVVQYFTRDPGAGLSLEWEGPNFRRTVLSGESVGQKDKRALSDLFRGLEKVGWLGTFWAGIGMVNNLAQAMVNTKALTPEDKTQFNPNFKEFILNEIDFTDANAPYWPNLGTRFEYRFAAKFTGNMMVTETGFYQFWLTSVDGSVLKIADQVICSNDGLHGKTTVEGERQLAPGTPKIEVLYFDNHHGSVLKLEWRGPQTEYKKVLLGAGGDAEPAVGQFNQDAQKPPKRRRRQQPPAKRAESTSLQRLRKLLSKSTHQTSLDSGSEIVVQELEPVPSWTEPLLAKRSPLTMLQEEEPGQTAPPSTPKKNRRRHFWARDDEKGTTDDKGECDCSGSRRRRAITSSMVFHRRRRADTAEGTGRRRRFSEKPDELGETAEPAPDAGKPPEEADMGGGKMKCRCKHPPRKGGFQADFWKKITGLDGLVKAIQTVKSNPPDTQKLIWKIDYPAEGGHWPNLDKSYDIDFVAAFQAYLTVKETGNYFFYLKSDDGAELYVDNTKVIDNDGLHMFQENSGQIQLHKDTLARIRVYYFVRTGAPGLVLEWKPPNGKRAVLDGENVWARETWEARRRASVKVRRRFVARRRVELTADELRHCGVPVKAAPAADASAPPSATSNEEYMQRIADMQNTINGLKPQETEAADRAENHPTVEARVHYAEAESDLKSKIKKLQDEQGVVMSQEKEFKKSHPAERSVQNATDSANPHAALCADERLTIKCCATGNCDATLVEKYQGLQLKIQEADAEAAKFERLARLSASPAAIETFMGKEKGEKNKINGLNPELMAVLGKLNKPPSSSTDKAAPGATTEETTATQISKLQETLKTTSDPAKQSQILSEIKRLKSETSPAQLLGEDSQPEPEAEGAVQEVQTEEAKRIMVKAREAAVKEKCSSMLENESDVKDQEAKLNAKEYKDKKAKQDADVAQLQEQWEAAKSNEVTIKGNPLATDAQKSDAQDKVDKLDQQLKDGQEKSDKWDAREKSAKGRLAVLAKKAAERKAKADEFKSKEASAKEKSVKLEKPAKEVMSKREVKAKSLESAAKKTAYEKVAQLPASCRPHILQRFLAETKDGQKIAVDVSPDGAVSTVGAPFRYVSLDGIMFATNPNPAADAQPEQTTLYLGEVQSVKHLGEIEQLPGEDGRSTGHDMAEALGSTGDWDDYRVVHIFDVNDSHEGSPLLGASNSDTAEPRKVSGYSLKEEGKICKSSYDLKGDFDDPFECAKMCNEDEQCKGFSWNPQKTGANKQQCAKCKDVATLKSDADKYDTYSKGDPNAEPAPLAWDEKATKKEFEAIQAKYNDPSVWTMCARQGRVCRDGGQFKMKYGCAGKFRYRVSDGNTPCDDNVFGAYEDQQWKDTKKKCYKYTPEKAGQACHAPDPLNPTLCERNPLFKDVAPKGIEATFYANMGSMSGVDDGANKAKALEPTKKFFVKDIMYPESTGYWSGLDEQFVENFFAKFSGLMMIAKDGKYTFYLTADDAAKLYIDRELTNTVHVIKDKTGQCDAGDDAECAKINKNSENGEQKYKDCLERNAAKRAKCAAANTVKSEAKLITKGTPKFELEFYANDGPHWLQVEWSGDDFSKRPLTDEFIGQYEKFVEEGGNWDEVSQDGGSFVLDAETEVRYGKLDAWVYKLFEAGEVKCNADSFGDPVADEKKSCWKRMDTQGSHWRPCAKEGQVCKGFPQNHKIRFGAEGKYTYMETAGDTPCDTDEFGDPNPGVQKQCFVLEVPEKPEPPSPDEPPKPHNLALNASATQISVQPWSSGTDGQAAFDGAASRAVDGITNGNYGAGSCTHTFAQTNPWWRVELEDVSVVYQVKIYARTDPVENCAHSQATSGSCALNDVNVYVGNKPYSYGDTKCNAEPFTVKAEQTIDCKQLQGKYVFVEKQGETSLSLCEVEVIGLGVKEAGGTIEEPSESQANSLFNVELQDGWQAIGKVPSATVERECDSCSSNLCILDGSVQQPAGITPSDITVLGKAPPMCRPVKKHSFLIANAVTGSAEVTVMPNGDLQVSKILNQVSWENIEIHLSGIYYFTNPTFSEKKLDEVPADKKDEKKDESNTPDGWDGFRFKKMGPYCLLWGMVGGKAGDSIGNVPSKCRPSQRLVFHAESSMRKAWISIDTGGVVRLETSGPTAPVYEKPEGWDVMGGSMPKLAPNAWVNPLAALEDDGNGTNSSNITCNASGHCVGKVDFPEPPLTTPLRAVYKNASFENKDRGVSSENPSPLQRTAASAQKAVAAAAEAAIAANTSQSTEEAGQKAKKLLHEVARHATEGFQHATDASGSGGLLELKYTQELAPQLNPQGSAVGPAPNHVHSANAENTAEAVEDATGPPETTGNGAADPAVSAAPAPAPVARLGEPEIFRVRSSSKLYGQEYAGIAPVIGSTQEILLQLSEISGESIRISLAGIVYSVADHHPFTRTKRQGLTPDQKKAFSAASAAVFPDEDECVLPKLQSKNLKEQFDAMKAQLDQLAQETTAAEGSAKTALTPAQAASYQTQLQGLKNKTREMRMHAVDVNANEMKVKRGNATCFLPALSTEAAAVLGVKNNTTDVGPEGKAKEMCSEAWNATVPDCCKEGCGNEQMKNLVNDLNVTIGFLENKQVAYKKAHDSATDAAAKAANQQMLEKTTSEIAESNVKRRLAMAAEREAKASGRLLANEAQVQLLDIR